MFEKFKQTIRNRKQSAENNEKTVNLDESEIEELKEKSEKMEEEEIQKNKKHFSEDGLWSKIQKFSKKAGSSVIYAVLLLYFTMSKEEVPVKVKATIAGALGYFILPLDLIPDVAPGVGFTDDLGVLIAALVAVAMYIDEDTKTQARNKLKDWFGNDVDTSVVDEKL